MRRNAQIQQVQPSPCNVIPFSELEKMISKQEKKPVRKEIIATEVQESLDHPRLIMESDNTCQDENITQSGVQIS